jgi:hypothetical protein
MREETCKRERSVHFDSVQWLEVQSLAGLSCKRELYACYFPSRLSKLDCTWMISAINDQKPRRTLELESPEGWTDITSC